VKSYTLRERLPSERLVCGNESRITYIMKSPTARAEFQDAETAPNLRRSSHPFAFRVKLSHITS
jgi:hypothetical protein